MISKFAHFRPKMYNFLLDDDGGSKTFEKQKVQ